MVIYDVDDNVATPFFRGQQQNYPPYLFGSCFWLLRKVKWSKQITLINFECVVIRELMKLITI